MQEKPLSKNILNGLYSEPKILPRIAMTDTVEQSLFEAVSMQENYYLNDCEREILEHRDLGKMLELNGLEVVVINLLSDAYGHFEYLKTNISKSLEIRSATVYDSTEKAATYEDSADINSLYAKNKLQFLNNSFGADFDVDKFSYQVNYCPEKGVLSHHLVSTAAQKVKFESIARPVMFSKWEPIRIAQTKLYSHQELNHELVSCGLATLDYVTDDKSWYAVYVVAKAPW